MENLEVIKGLAQALNEECIFIINNANTFEELPCQSSIHILKSVRDTFGTQYLAIVKYEKIVEEWMY